MIQVYALVASDEPLQVRYIGVTKRSLSARLCQHWIQSWTTWRGEWMRHVRDRGAQVQLRVLSTHNRPIEARDAEQKWIRFWKRYCQLLNMDEGGYPVVV